MGHNIILLVISFYFIINLKLSQYTEGEKTNFIVPVLL